MKLRSPHHLVRIEPNRNMARFYRLAIEPSLFGDTCLVQDWGRIGARGQRRIRLFTSLDEAVRQFQAIASAKAKRGYVPSHGAILFVKKAVLQSALSAKTTHPTTRSTTHPCCCEGSF